MSESRDRFTVSVYASDLTHTEAARAAEVLARPLAGLGLDGIGASLNVRPDRPDVPTDDEPDAADCLDGRRARSRLRGLADSWTRTPVDSEATSALLVSCADELLALLDGIVL